jgi:hypothetical protein
MIVFYAVNGAVRRRERLERYFLVSADQAEHFGPYVPLRDAL